MGFRVWGSNAVRVKVSGLEMLALWDLMFSWFSHARTQNCVGNPWQASMHEQERTLSIPMCSRGVRLSPLSSRGLLACRTLADTFSLASRHFGGESRETRGFALTNYQAARI